MDHALNQVFFLNKECLVISFIYIILKQACKYKFNYLLVRSLGINFLAMSFDIFEDSLFIYFLEFLVAIYTQANLFIILPLTIFIFLDP
jgi:hypothetical protein